MIIGFSGFQYSVSILSAITVAILFIYIVSHATTVAHLSEAGGSRFVYSSPPFKVKFHIFVCHFIVERCDYENKTKVKSTLKFVKAF